MSDKGNRVFLDRGAVAVMAEVVVKGKNLGFVWKPPFRMDVTDVIKPGENNLEVHVANLWPNRLIGDEQLSPENEYKKWKAPGLQLKHYRHGIRKGGLSQPGAAPLLQPGNILHKTRHY